MYQDYDSLTTQTKRVNQLMNAQYYEWNTVSGHWGQAMSKVEQFDYEGQLSSLKQQYRWMDL